MVEKIKGQRVGHGNILSNIASKGWGCVGIEKVWERNQI